MSDHYEADTYIKVSYADYPVFSGTRVFHSLAEYQRAKKREGVNLGSPRETRSADGCRTCAEYRQSVALEVS